MFRRSWFVLFACLGLASAGCQKGEPPQRDAGAGGSGNVESVPDNVDGRKVFDALTTSLKKAATTPAVPANQPGEGPAGSARPLR